jgi:hypothetical protein
MKIAIQLPQFMGWHDLLERAVFADRLGFHSIWLNDHFIHFMAAERDHPEALTLLTVGRAHRNDAVEVGLDLVGR